jgi:hypothetical protein
MSAVGIPERWMGGMVEYWVLKDISIPVFQYSIIPKGL